MLKPGRFSPLARPAARMGIRLATLGDNAASLTGALLFHVKRFEIIGARRRVSASLAPDHHQRWNRRLWLMIPYPQKTLPKSDGLHNALPSADTAKKIETNGLLTVASITRKTKTLSALPAATIIGKTQKKLAPSFNDTAIRTEKPVALMLGNIIKTIRKRLSQPLSDGHKRTPTRPEPLNIIGDRTILMPPLKTPDNGDKKILNGAAITYENGLRRTRHVPARFMRAAAEEQENKPPRGQAS